MAIFGRKKEDTPVAPEAPVTVPAARDADLTAANLRPAAPKPAPAAPKEAPALSQTIRPTATTAPAPNAPAIRPGMPGPGVGVPARPQSGGNAVPQSDRRTLTVGKGISVTGTVADCERLVVEGTVESEMLQAAELSVGQTGVFRGEVQVEDAEIAGLFDGTITARGNLIIRATGKVNGVARCKRLSVEDGGQLMGRMEMLTDGPAAPRPAPQG